jgi:hypothetical protein
VSSPARVILYRLGRDPEIDGLRRGAARLLSFYQRAPAHFLAEAGWGEFDWMASSLLRWLLLRLCGQRTRWWREQPCPADLPSSGWRGSLMVAAVWIGSLAAVSLAFPIRPDALIR